jgi:hypothetical protein
MGHRAVVLDLEQIKGGQHSMGRGLGRHGHDVDQLVKKNNQLA